MIWNLHQIVLALHILLAIIWVGGLLFVGWGVFPSIQSFNYKDQRNILLRIMKHSHHLFTIAGLGVILTGIILGTVLGPIHDWNNIWNTTFGKLWVTALLVASFSLAWGVFVGYKVTLKVLNKETLWVVADRGIKQPLYQSLVMLFLIESVEPLGFFILIILMVFL